MRKKDKKSETKRAKKQTLTMYDCCWYEPSYYRLCCDDVWCR